MRTAIALALLALLVACGGGGGDAAEPSTPGSGDGTGGPGGGTDGAGGDGDTTGGGGTGNGDGSVVQPIARGLLVSARQTGVLARDAIEKEYDDRYVIRQLAGGPPRCDVELHEVVYETVAPDGSAARASAGLAIPVNCDGPYPVVVYHHGTEAKRDSTMADPQNGETQVIVWFFAAQGYVAVMPDYHGYAQSTLGYHPYLHAENTAAVSIDALRAARTTLAQREVPTHDRLFLWGYSQGGHSAMATHRAMERDFPAEFDVTASSPASGPYALDFMVLDVLQSPTYGASAFAPMLLVGLQKAYGDVYATPGEVFQPPYEQWIDGLLPGSASLGDLVGDGLLPATLTGPGGLLTDGFVASYVVDAEFPARRRVADNDLRGWIPRAPMKLCGGSRDEVVPFYNATLAQASFASMGAPVEIFDVEEDTYYGPFVSLLRRLGLDEGGYHAGIVPLLCASVARLNVFDPLR